MKLKMTPNQKLWSDVFRCAVERSNLYFKEKDLDRQKREHTTVVLSLQKGEQFWRHIL
jgi:hypothetical protein